MKETNKKEIVLEDLFFKTNGKVLDVINDLNNYDTVIYYDIYSDCILNASALQEYMARLDTYIDAQFIQLPSLYDNVIMYRLILEYIQQEIKYQKSHPYESFKDRYNGMNLNINIIKEIRNKYHTDYK